MTESGGAKGPNQRLDSWKEIAAFFQRDERTVKRWEKERGLPVHRLQGSSTGRVYAFTDELAEWMKTPVAASPDSADVGPVARTIYPPGEVPRRRASDSAEVEAVLAGLVKDEDREEFPPEKIQTRNTSRVAWWFVACVVLALLLIAFFFYYRHVTSRPMPPKARPVAEEGGGSNVLAHNSLAPSTREPDPGARDLYLKGRYEWNKRTPQSLNKAVDYFTQAIVHDPNYAEAYVGLADSYNLLREYGGMPPDEAYPRALAAARKAVELDDASAEAHLSLAFVTFYGQLDAAGADREFRRALSLNPNYARAHHWYATFLMSVGHYQDAVKEIEIAQQLDPASTAILADKGLLLLYADRRAEGVAILKQLERNEPSLVSSYRYMQKACLMNNDYPGYLTAREQSARLSHDEPEIAIVRAGKIGYEKGQEQGMWQGVLKKQKELYAQGQVPAYALAMTYSLMGIKPEALHYLAIAEQNHEPAITGVHDQTIFASLHGEPEYIALIGRLGLQ